MEPKATQEPSVQEEARRSALERSHEARTRYFEAIAEEDRALSLATDAPDRPDIGGEYVQARERKRTAREGFVKATVEARIQGIDVASALAPDS